MKSPFKIFKEAEDSFDEYLQWQIDYEPTNRFMTYAIDVCSVEKTFQYAAILYPRFIKVEGVIVLEDHYIEDNWNEWRKTLSPQKTADMINHVHIEDFLYRDHSASEKMENHLGELLSFFWKMALDKQFPGNNVIINFDGDVINIYEK